MPGVRAGLPGEPDAPPERPRLPELWALACAGDRRLQIRWRRLDREPLVRRPLERSFRVGDDPAVGSEAAVPPEGEVRAVAEVLGRRPDELAAVKLPGPGRLLE